MEKGGPSEEAAGLRPEAFSVQKELRQRSQKVDFFYEIARLMLSGCSSGKYL